MSGARIVESVMELANPLATELEFELVDVEYRKEGPDWVLRCTIDCKTGVGINECQRFSEVLGKSLDTADLIPGHYLLEVSSPGIDRPLKKDSDFVRFAGSNLEIKLAQPIDGKKVYHGVLLGMREDEAQQSRKIIIDDNGKIIEIPRQQIMKAQLYQEIFSPKKGGKKPK